jgi:hypothetical protein
MNALSYIRELKRRLRFKLIKLEEAKFDAYVRAFRLIRSKILDDSDVTDKEERRARFDAEDVEAGARVRRLSHAINHSLQRKHDAPRHRAWIAVALLFSSDFSDQILYF